MKNWELPPFVPPRNITGQIQWWAWLRYKNGPMIKEERGMQPIDPKKGVQTCDIGAYKGFAMEARNGLWLQGGAWAGASTLTEDGDEAYSMEAARLAGRVHPDVDMRFQGMFEEASRAAQAGKDNS